MEFKLPLILVVLSAILLSGCGSTIRQDGYVKHVNRLDLKKVSSEEIKFSLPESHSITLHAIHHKDATATQTSVVYTGSAGLGGLIAQIGTHAALVESSRSNKLTKVQEQANLAIKPLIDITDLNSIASLKNLNLNKLESELQISTNNFKIKPIFYSSRDMKSISLKMAIWQERETKRNKGKYNYLNLVQIYGDPFTQVQLDKIKQGEHDIFLSKLSRYLNQAILIAEKDILGHYRNVNKVTKTFLVKQGGKSKVVRGKLLEKDCKFSVIKNLHSWLIYLPNDKDVINAELALQECGNPGNSINT